MEKLIVAICMRLLGAAQAIVEWFYLVFKLACLSMKNAKLRREQRRLRIEFQRAREEQENLRVQLQR